MKFLALPVMIALLGCGEVSVGHPDAGLNSDPDAMPNQSNIDAGLDAMWEEPNYAFVTPTTVNAGFGGLSGADTHCQTAAVEAGLPGTYRAWVSTSLVSAKSRLTNASGWIRVDGLPIANTVEDLTAGRILYPINIDPSGARFDTDVWTGTGENGEAMTDTCDDWTNSSSGTVGFGSSRGGTSRWTQYRAKGCGRLAALYCFGIDREGRTPGPSATGRTVFVSKATFSGTAGLAAFDEGCKSEAVQAGLTGDYIALVGRQGLSAASRLSLNNDQWVRPDGAVVAGDDSQFTGNDLVAPISVTASGVYTDAMVWTGSTTFGEPASAVCGNWSDGSQSGAVGDAAMADDRSAYSRSYMCSASHAVYCAQK